jgi:hypothetical protein
MVVQGVNMQNDGITEFSRMQNNSPNDFNGPGVEGGDMGQEVLELYEDVVLERLSTEQVKDVARLLIEYVKDEVPIENWEGQPPAKTVNLLRMLLKNRDKVTAWLWRRSSERVRDCLRRLSARKKRRAWLKRRR